MMQNIKFDKRIRVLNKVILTEVIFQTHFYCYFYKLPKYTLQDYFLHFETMM